MKLMIEIDEEDYHRIASGFGQEEDALLLEKIFKNGTPIPDNATNLDVLKIMFPDYIPKDFTWVLGGDGADWDKPKGYCGNWWNAPYQKGGK